jgi:hypothetical protein
MTDHDDFDAQLKASLERRAGQAPHTDLASGALRQAGRIRARRRVAGAAAVAVVAAVAIPVGAGIMNGRSLQDPTATQPADTLTTSTVSTLPSPPTSASPTTVTGPPPAPIDIALPDLPRGDDPAVPYIDDRTFWADGASYRLELVPGGYPYSATVWPDGTVLGWYAGGPTTNFGAAEGLVLSDELSVNSGPVVDSDSSVAWVQSGVDRYGNSVGDRTLSYARSLDDMRTAPLGNVSIRNMVAVRDGVTIVNAMQGNKSVVLRVDMLAADPQVEQPWPSLTYVSTVSQDQTLMAVSSDRLVEPNDSPCGTIVEADDLSRLWQSCDWYPIEFSADGSRVLAQPVGTEGFGPRSLAVLDAASGAVLQEFTAAGFFGAGGFEDNDNVDMVVVADSGQTAIVRCTVAEDCELATDPKPAALDSLSQPYTLTANP